LHLVLCKGKKSWFWFQVEIFQKNPDSSLLNLGFGSSSYKTKVLVHSGCNLYAGIISEYTLPLMDDGLFFAQK
jgi:hypothetical protein